MQTWQWYQSLHQKVMSTPSCKILHYIWGQQFSCVILYVGEKDRRSLRRRQTYTHTHTQPPQENRRKGEGEKWNGESRGRTHTELQMDWNTDAKSGRGREMCTHTHTHTLIQKSIFKSIARLFCPCGSDKEIRTQTSCVLDYWKALRVVTEVRGREGQRSVSMSLEGTDESALC